MVWRWTFVIGFCLCLGLSQLLAQPASKSELLTIETLQKRITTAQKNIELAANVKEKILQYLQDAVTRIEIAQEQIEKAEKLEQRLTAAEDALRSTKRRVSELPAKADPSVASVEDLDELNRVVESREKERDDVSTGLKKQLADLDAEAELRRKRPPELTNELAEIDERLRDIDAELEGLSNSGERGESLQAHQSFLQARRQRAESERRALAAESAWYQSTMASDLLETQRELVAKSLALTVAELEILHAELARRRGDEAEQRVRQAEAVSGMAPPTLKPVADENVVLAKEHRDVTNQLREVTRRHETTTATLDELSKEFDRTQTMVASVGLTDAIGLLLRQQRARLPDPRATRSSLAHRNDAVRETRMRLFQLDLDRLALMDLDAAFAKRALEYNLPKNRKPVTSAVHALLVEQRQLNKGLENEYSKYFKQSIELDIAERQLLELTLKYADYVDERVLWIRTGQTFGKEQLARVPATWHWISDAKLWQPVIDAGFNDAYRRPISWIMAGLFFAVWVCIGPLINALIRRRGTIAAGISCRELVPTIQTIALTFALASGWPALLWFFSWRLERSASTVLFVHSVAAGLLRAATFAFPLEVLRIVCARGGLAEHHFDWPLQSVKSWRRNLNWFLPIGAVSIGLIGLIEAIGDEHRLDASGRLTFLMFAALSAVFNFLTLRRSKTTRTTEEGGSVDEADAWSDRFWRFAPQAAVALCLGLFILGWTGYFYTALQLTWRLQKTAWLVIGLLLVRAVIRRWIAMERRRMSVLQDAELQTIANAENQRPNANHNPSLFPRWNWPDLRLNVTQIVAQMRRLLDMGLMTVGVVGIWFVWSDVTPALNILDRVTLWETTVEQTVTSEDGAQGSVVQTIKRPKRVTAADLGLASLVVGIAIIAGRNIPGLVEVILMEQLSVDAGTRFAATCLVRYAIFVTGVTCAFGQIGVGWNSVQWLVAAGSVGLGFGLQEIFCNFVSGIILLFERPMRVGDVITIGDTTGTVSRMQFRATTIVDGDRKELIVPNKEFITGKLLNWTLSDRINRVAVKVVVSNDNNPQRVHRLLLEIAGLQPLLLKDPAPSVTLEEINGGLTFMLRGFLPTLDGRSTAVHDLYTVIHDRFQAEGIEMSCPTQEVLVRMERHDAHSPIPSAPHPATAGIPLKPVQPDFTSAFRRA